MPLRRITYQNWIAELGHDPHNIHTTLPGAKPEAAAVPGRSALEQLRRVVRSSLKTLSVQERHFVIRFYFQGLSYRNISEESGQTAAKLIGLHRRALRKLRCSLAPFVKRRFEIETGGSPGCPICRSPHRQGIDNIIACRDESRSWRPVISAIKEKYSLTIRSPQVLIGHEKYHG